MMKNLGLILTFITCLAYGRERDGLILRGRVPSSIDFNFNADEMSNLKRFKQRLKANVSSDKYTVREIIENNSHYIEIIFN